MALRLQMTSRHRQSLGERGAKEFGSNGGTIGRSLESDWVLPDGQRYLSSRHASIDYRSGSYYIVDTSTNGVYVNDAETPVGRGNPQRLFTGDRIRLGEYEMTVEIDEEDSTDEHLADGNHVDPVERAKRVDPPDPTSADLVQAHEITAVGIEMLISEETEAESLKRAAQLSAANLRLEDDPQPPKHGRPAEPAKQAQSPPQQPARQKAHPKPEPSLIPKATAANSLLANTATGPRLKPPTGETRQAGAAPTLEAFFRGAGLPSQKLDEKQVDLVLHGLGQLMREVIVGLGENLHVRTDQKNTLRIANTTIQPQNNNPLKFSATVDEALNNLFFRQPAEYLSAVDAVREAFIDIKSHQQNLLNAVRTAVADYVARLDPDELEHKFTSGKRGGLMSAAQKLKYWDLYKDLYQVVTQQSPGQFPQLFIEDVARSYEHEDARAGAPQPGKPQTKIAG